MISNRYAEELEQENKQCNSGCRTKVKEGFTTMDVLKEENKEQKEEIERLNNIINELEKEFDKELENLVYREEKLYTQGIHDTIINHKHLLQELKGSDK